MNEVDLAHFYVQVLNPLLNYLADGIALALAGWLLMLLHKALQLLGRYLPAGVAAFLEAKAAKDLNTALANGVAAGMHKVEDIEALHSKVQVKGALQAFAMQYALDHAPGAIKRFGLDPEALMVKALAYIPVAPTTADLTGQVVRTIPVQTAPLAAP